MATEEQGPKLDVSALRLMILDARALAAMARGTIIHIFAGNLDDPTSVSPWHFGEFLRYDAANERVTYRVIEGKPQRTFSPRGIRAMVTDEQSGLYLPEGTRDPKPEEHSVRLDESYFVVDGAKYVAFLAAPRPARDDELY